MNFMLVSQDKTCQRGEIGNTTLKTSHAERKQISTLSENKIIADRAYKWFIEGDVSTKGNE